MDNFDGVAVDVVALAAKSPAPHVELLAYRTPLGRASPFARPSAIAASRLAFAAYGLDDWDGAVTLANGERACLIHDPDGHALLLEQSR